MPTRVLGLLDVSPQFVGAEPGKGVWDPPQLNNRLELLRVEKEFGIFGIIF